MEVHQLRYLLAVVETGSFTAAGERERVSQSGISAQIAKLERELGGPLLERGRSVRLTSAGECVLPLAREVLAGVDSISAVAQELRQALRGRVRLGMIVGCDIPPFLDAISTFQAAHPGVDLSLHEADSPLLRSRVFDGDLDLALVSEAGDAAASELRTVRLSDEHLAVGIADSHPKRRSQVRLRDLAQEHVLCLPPGTGIRTALERSAARASVDIEIGLHASSPSTLIALAERATGVAVLAESMFAGTDLAVRPLIDAEVTAGLRLISRARCTPAATRLYDGIAAAMTG